MELATKLSRRAFAGLVVLVGIILLPNLPSLEEAQNPRTDKLLNFAVDDRITLLNHHLKISRYAEVSGDSARHSKEYYRTAMDHVRRAGYFSEKYSSGGYVDQVIVKSVRRLERKLRK